MIALTELLKGQKKTLILDESFVDFSEEENASLFRQDILNNYPNLVLIKSLSKSYGISGIRLGVLASGNKEIIKDVHARLSSRNINSFAEYFLQIIGKYQKDYHLSCKKLIAERERFRNLLHKTNLLHVYPSQANYFLCRIIKNDTASELAERLLWEHDILIKDLSGKKGIPDKSYIRVAIRNLFENDVFLKKLYRE